jgi:hypothetical protein
LSFRRGELTLQPFMEAPTNQPTPARERKIIFVLGILAAAHVFIFSAAFPFFNVVDEQVHLDLVVRYSQADVPRTLTPPAAEALPFIAIYGTPEYLWTPASQPGGRIAPPPWQQPPAAVRESLRAKEAGYQAKFQNHEASQPPLYYSLAGAWWRLGKSFGLDGLALLYWLRFFNVPIIVALVWLGWIAARRIFPANPFIRVAVPALIAFLPQTAFYSIQNDVLSPLTFGSAFVLLLQFWDAEIPSVRLAAAVGLPLAATFLTKISNLPLLVVAGIFLALKILRLAQNGKLRASISALAVLLAAAGVPMMAWMTWCKINFGDYTGSSLKIHFLGWTTQPFAAWFQHPLFTPHGLWIFVSGNLATFWQGEFLWHREPLALPGVDLFYVVLTGLALAFALAGTLRRPAPRAALWFSGACLAALLGFFALLSVKYDFQDCFYPSREHPFFTSGRLMLGALIPFLLLFTFGLDQAMQKFSSAIKFAVLAALLLFMLAAEITIDWPIFPNAYNWFHR